MWQPAAYYSGRRGPVLNHDTISRLASLMRAVKAVHPSQSVPATYIFSNQDVIKDRSNFNKVLTSTPGFVKTYQAGTVGWYFDERMIGIAREQGQEIYPLNTTKIPDDLPSEMVDVIVPVVVATPEDTVDDNKPWFHSAKPLDLSVNGDEFARETFAKIVALSEQGMITPANLGNLNDLGESIATIFKSMQNPEDF